MARLHKIILPASMQVKIQNHTFLTSTMSQNERHADKGAKQVYVCCFIDYKTRY